MDDGELREYTNPESREFLAAVMRGTPHTYFYHQSLFLVHFVKSIIRLLNTYSLPGENILNSVKAILYFLKLGTKPILKMQKCVMQFENLAMIYNTDIFNLTCSGRLKWKTAPWLLLL